MNEAREDLFTDILVHMKELPIGFINDIISHNGIQFTSFLYRSLGRRDIDVASSFTSPNLLEAIGNNYSDLCMFNKDDKNLTYLNAIFYHIIVNLTTSEEIDAAVFNAANKVNKSIVDRLTKDKIIDRQLAIFLSIANFSSFIIRDCINRVNFTLAASSGKVLSINDIINIYHVFFSEDFSKLLIYTIFDTKISNAIQQEESWITDTIKANNDNIIDAIFTILNSMDSATICDYIREVYKEYIHSQYTEDNMRVEFSTLLSTLKYPNVMEAYYNLRDTEKMYLP